MAQVVILSCPSCRGPISYEPPYWQYLGEFYCSEACCPSSPRHKTRM